MLRKLIIVAVVVTLLFVGGIVALFIIFTRPAPTPDVFAEGLTVQAATARSAEVDRPLLLFVTADWCFPCQLLKRGALTDVKVEEIIRARTVPLYVDVTGEVEDAALRDLLDAVGVGPIPAMILVRDGAELSRMEGLTSAADIVAWLERGE